MKRLPEPEELMNEPGQARAYAEADFSEPNRLFVDLFAEAADDFRGTALDLGCGPGDIPIAFAERFPGATVEVLDGAEAMLDIAREKLARVAPALAGRVILRHAMLPCPTLPEQGYDAVLSNSLLHHLADPLDLWRTVRQCGRPGARVLVMDLARPASDIGVDALVESYALDAPEVLRRDFRNSLYAAYTPAEVADQLAELGLGELEVGMVSDRHLAVRGRLAD
jgi:ubiquinone/menaquinone biosynthesis C-methylase UbiE